MAGLQRNEEELLRGKFPWTHSNASSFTADQVSKSQALQSSHSMAALFFFPRSTEIKTPTCLAGTKQVLNESESLEKNIKPLMFYAETTTVSAP